MKLQIALEFMIIFSLVVVIFLVLLALITNERALGLSSQTYAQLQLVAQTLSSQINNAVSSGSGYTASIPVTGYIGTIPYNVTVTKGGIVILQMLLGKQVMQAYAYSSARGIVSNPRFLLPNNAYLIPVANGTVSITNSQGTICIDYSCPSTTAQASHTALSTYTQQFSQNTIITTNTTNSFGTPVPGALVGYVTSLGTFSNGNPVFVGLTNANGIVSSTLSSTTNGIATVKATSFNGNLSTESNLVAWYPMNFGEGSTLYDLSGHGNNGAMSNTQWANTLAEGNASSALVANFNGASSYIFTANTNAFNLGRGSSLSVTAWIYPQSNAIQYREIVAQASNTGYAFAQNGIRLAFVANALNSPVTSTFATGLTVNAFNFVGVTYNDTTGTAIFYIGSSSNTQSLTANQMGATSAPLYIGSLASNNFALGNYANIQMYNTSLSQQKIQALYQEGIDGLPVAPKNLLGWWPLNGNANDYSNKGNNGTASNVIYVAPSVNMPQPNSSINSYGVYFNGQSSNIIVQSSNSISPSSQISAFAWFKPNSQTSAILQKQGSYGMKLSSGNLIGYVGSSSACASFPFLLLPGRSYFVGFTFNGSAIANYVNGALYCITSYSNTIPVTSNALAFGGPQDTDGYVNGTMANVQIYNTALTQAQIMQLYKAGMPPSATAHVAIP